MNTNQNDETTANTRNRCTRHRARARNWIELKMKKLKIDQSDSYEKRMDKATDLMSEQSLYLISCILKKHNKAIIEVGLEQKELITRLEHENEIMRNALIHINCESINAEEISLKALEAIKLVPNVEVRGCALAQSQPEGRT